ncbi:MAG: PAS domain S-box protein, partial [Candidatus Omnitrophica bacterium]|nr:PAS domain S-box protein [Candidatus Omnitrophota bacterium]
MQDKSKKRFTIHQKLTIFIVISFSIVGLVGLGLMYWSEYRLLRQTISRDYLTMAQLLGSSLDRIVSREIKSIEVFMASYERLQDVEKYNLKYAGMSNEQKKAYFKGVEEQWAKATDNDSLITEYTKSAVGIRLKEIALDDPSIAEIFMTDKYGGLVAASDRTTDFYQADEEWWQKSFDNGQGNVFVDKIGLDPSSKALGLAISVPIKNRSKEVIGVCKSVLEINRLFSPLINFSIGKSGHVTLIDKQGNLIFHPGIQGMTRKLPYEATNKIISQDSGYLLANETAQLHKGKVFIFYFKVNHPVLLESGLEWWICVVQDDAEVFAPLAVLIFSFIPAALAMLALIVLTGLLFSRILVKPILELVDATEKIAKGNLNYKVDIKANDEIKDLADSFNSMLASLKNTFTTVDKLNDEIALRKKTEETLHKSEEQYRTLFTESRDAVMVLSSDEKFISGNPAAIKMFGCQDENEFKSKSAADLSPEFQPDGSRSVDKSRKMMMLAVGKGSNLFEWTHKRMDGVEFISTVLLSKFEISGQVFLQATVRDITERVKAEKRINKLNKMQTALLNPGKLEDKLKVITDSVVDIFKAEFSRIWLMAPGDQCNSGCPHAAVKQGPHVCINRDHCLHLVSSSGCYTHIDGGHSRVPFGCYKIGGIASGEFPSFLTNDVTHDPRVHNHEWAGKLGLVSFAGFRLGLSDNETIGVLALFSKHHISTEEYALIEAISTIVIRVIKASQAEEAIKKSEAWFSTTLTSIGDAVITVDTEGNITFINPVAQKLTGWLAAEAIGRHIDEVFIIKKEDTDEKVDNPILKVLSNGQIVNLANHTVLISKDGSRCAIDDSAAPIRNEASQ